MYCPVEMISLFLTSDINGMHRKRAAFVSPTILHSAMSLYTLRFVFVQCHKGFWENVDQHHS